MYIKVNPFELFTKIFNHFFFRVVEDSAMRKYILDKAAAPYFSNIVWFIREQCTNLDSVVSNARFFFFHFEINVLIFLVGG